MFTVGLFWAIHGAYILWLNPMPLARELAGLRFLLAAFPGTLVVLHWAPLIGSGAKKV